jgi:teichuronic acid biosynthesis glycosyltransferase TuaH
MSAPLRSTGCPCVPARKITGLIVCSLENWDDVWRRNQFLTQQLLQRNDELRVLFVEPPVDPLFDLSQRRVPTFPRLRRVAPEQRLVALRPAKIVPRRFGRSGSELHRQVLLAARLLRLRNPTLWINDVTYAPLIRRTGWPALYDVTDDWLLAPVLQRERSRLRRLDEMALRDAGQVVVCSEALAETRRGSGQVVIIPNGVDIEHFRRVRGRPADLSNPPIAVYVGTLHDARIDVELVVELARGLPSLSVVLIGPDALSSGSRARLNRLPNVQLLGPRPYSSIPAYLQHADVIIVPHVVSPFTESLDPIKAYECLAVDRPVVATPVAGFRQHAADFDVVGRESFSSAVARALSCDGIAPSKRSTPVDWTRRAADFEEVLPASGSIIRGAEVSPLT